MSSDPYLAYLRRFFARWAPLYDLFAATIAPAYHAVACRATPGPGARLVDLCTGTGEVARRCAARGAKVVGVDMAEVMLLRARRKTRGRRGVTLAFMDVRQLALRSGCCDTAILSFALHDMPRKARIESLREAARVSRSGRVLVLDYELRGPRWLRRVCGRLVEVFETVYFRGFVREGIPRLLAATELSGHRISSPMPGLVSLWQVEPAGSTDVSGESPTASEPETRRAR